MSRSTRRLLKQLAALLALGLLSIGGVMGLRAVAGGGVGEACSLDYGCKPGMRCVRLHGVEKMCTRYCDVETECPTGWGCGEVLVVNRNDVMASIRHRICMPGAPGP